MQVDIWYDPFGYCFKILPAIIKVGFVIYSKRSFRNGTIERGFPFSVCSYMMPATWEDLERETILTKRQVVTEIQQKVEYDKLGVKKF